MVFLVLSFNAALAGSLVMNRCSRLGGWALPDSALALMGDTGLLPFRIQQAIHHSMDGPIAFLAYPVPKTGSVKYHGAILFFYL